MAQYLVTLSLGPVQSLIEAARRTRDLWCGSWLLAEAAKAAALVLHNHQPGCLIFPCPANPELDLAASARIKDEDANIANVLRALVEADDDSALGVLLQTAKQAAADRLAGLCQQGKNRLADLPFHQEIWDAQCQDILESFAVWVKIGEGGYAAASERLGALLAARKATRNCLPAAAEANGIGFGIPKSSLDGARESVINLPRYERKKDRHRTALLLLGLAEGEELDTLGIAKRMAGEVDQFTAYSRIAADAWIDSLPDNTLSELNRAYEPLISAGLATRVKGNAGIYQKLPYDAQLLYGFRLENAVADAKEAKRASEEQLLKALKVGLEGLDEPVPYAVILKADGDRMGELLGRAGNAEESREISKALHGFAQAVRGIVREHRGHAIYAGGDDVLALLPLQQAVLCATALAKAFKDALDTVAGQLGLEETERPTLSVGLGIGHLMQPLGALRARADMAEKDAKGNDSVQPRNALAIRLGVRSGTEISYRCRWDDSEGLTMLQSLIQAYRDNQCPSRLAFELRAIAIRLNWAKDAKNGPLPGIHAAELTRTLGRKRQSGSDGELTAAMKETLSKEAARLGLSVLADALIIARWLSARTVEDIGALQ